ncbi:MAG: hypothetical protein WD669_11785 [Pirellulales bacterium]
MTTRTATPASTGPLTAEHHRELALAQERGAKIRKAAGVASFNGWITGIIAASSALFTMVSFSLVGLLLTAGLAAVAYNEFRGRDRLLAFDPSAAAVLGWNQLGLLAMITVYCGWMMFTSLTGPSPISAELQSSPEVREVLGDMSDLDGAIRYVSVAFYGLVIVLSAIFQGLNSLYYFTRRRHVEAYVRETPEWVRDVQRSTGAG